MDKTLNVLRQFCSEWQSNLKLGKTYNTPLSIGFEDARFELLTCVEHDIKGTGSISHGYDHNNHDETKGTSWIQPKKCDNCQGKVHFFSKTCACGSENFKYINDSRWGIDANAHFIYKVRMYHLWVLLPESYSHDCTVFKLKQYIIDGNNKPFNDILEVQLERSSSKGKNFLPFSSDFYASNPKEISSFTIVFDEIFGVDVTRNQTEEIVYTKDIVKKMMTMMDLSFLNDKDTYHYDELLPYINVKNKKTSHGKLRGETKRRDK
jgi:hypothetical protein